MSRALLFYFTQGGSTLKVAEAITGGLRGRGYETEIRNIRDGVPPDFEEYQLYGFGSPTYIYRLPFAVKDFIQALPNLKDRPFFVFQGYGTLPGTAGTKHRRILRKKGGMEVGYFTYRGSDLFLGYLKMGVLFSPENPLGKELKDAEKFGEDVADRAAEGIEFVSVDDQPPTLIHRMETMVMGRFMVNHFYIPFFKAGKESCRSCGHCVDICPQNNIKLADNGRPEWGRNCLACFYCETECPEEAIQSPLDWALFRPFMAYNIAHAKRDSSLEWYDVELKKGEISGWNNP